jgi:hypothetical protein
MLTLLIKPYCSRYLVDDRYLSRGSFSFDSSNLTGKGEITIGLYYATNAVIGCLLLRATMREIRCLSLMLLLQN